MQVFYLLEIIYHVELSKGHFEMKFSFVVICLIEYWILIKWNTTHSSLPW